jgi:CDP-6-deoxy-D-xylo-4-hexulose-3-dehydrase
MADRIHHCGFFLPNHPALTDDDVTFIARVVREAT